MPKRKLSEADMEDKRIVIFPNTVGDKHDLTIVCGHLQFLVHQATLVAISKFMEKAMSVDMKEKKERKIDLKDKEAHIVQAFIYFAYNRDYHDRVGNDPNITDKSLTFNAKIYALADEYLAPKLKELAKKKFGTLLQHCFQTVDRDFENATKLLWETTPEKDRGLRDLAADAAVRHFDQLRTPWGFIRALANAGFGGDVAIALFKDDQSKLKRYSCPNCYKQIVFEITTVIAGEAHCPRCGKRSYVWPSNEVKA